MKKHLFLILALVFLALNTNAQPNCVFTHYSSEDGLSQNSVMSMVQDYNGVLWFSTWDGINKFDGYDFKIYKARQGNKIALTNNRVDVMKVDPYNYIWVLTYDNHAFRFDQKTERFESVPADEKGEGMRCTDIKILSDGVVWMPLESEGAIRVKTNPEDFSLTTRLYATRGQGEGGFNARVHNIYKDRKQQEWLLTSNGLMKVGGDNEKPATYFVNSRMGNEEANQAFYTCCTYGDEIYFGSDKGRIWCYSLENDIFRLWELPLKDKIVSINEIEGLGLLVTTRSQGLVVYNAETKESKVYNKSNCPAFPSDDIHSVYVDSKQQAWFEMTVWGEVCHFNPFTGVFKQDKMKVEPQGAERSYPAFHICEDMNGNLWVHPQGGGLSWYDRQADKLLPFYNDPNVPAWRFSNKLHSMLSDKQGNLWLSTHSKGLEKVTFYGRQFHLYPHAGRSYDLNSNTVRALFEDSEHRIWMSKRDGKIEVYTNELSYLGYLTEGGMIAKNGQPLSGVAYHIMQDSKGNIWIATKGKGVVLAQPDGGGYKLIRFEYNEDDIYSLSHNSAYWLHEDKHGRIWVATFGGGLNYIDRTPEGNYIFINNRNNLKGFPTGRFYRLRHITSDRKGNIWVSGTDGALCFKEDFREPESIKFHLYAPVPGDMNCLSSSNVYRILTTRDGNVYVATFGGGLNQLVSMDEQGNAVFKSYTIQDGLLSDILLSIEEDDNGNLWMSTESGLSKFLPAEQRFENYNERDFGDKLRFEESTSLNLSSRTMLFGTSNGVVYFNPEEISKSDYVPPVLFSGLKISNQEVAPGVEGGILPQALNNTGHLVLSHKENIVTFSFAALDWVYPENIRYAYRLEGFDKGWNYVGKQRTATYTNLPKGDYVFWVKSTNSDGVWVENERSMQLTILPSFWETPWAMVLYVLAFLCILLAGVYILFTIYRLKHEVSVEQQVSDIKLRFFTNISHELRTPLTLIAGPVEYVLKTAGLSDDVREQLRIVERNTDRMLRLVNQILDFRKIQKNKMRLRIEQIDIVPFVHQLMDNFESLAEDHHIDFLFESEKPSLKLWVDTDKLEKIVFNLLSNAFKYTPQGKMITLFIHENENSVAVGVQDQGIGISESKKASLFVRFENLLDKNLFNQQSSGIGLSLVKELVELHQASIRVDSKEGEGSCFTVEFLKGKEHFTENVDFIISDDIEMGVERPVSTVADGSGTASSEEDEMTNPGEHKTMLLVEDNLELRFFLRSIFLSEFNVIEATNGAEGLAKALKFVPDIIISDIMMPEMDGIAMTKEIRENMSTSHIPVVLLTAKSDTDSKLQGMEQGADDYITKPFSATYLKARVENILARRNKLQQLYREKMMGMQAVSLSEETEEPQRQQPEMSVHDRKFMDKLTELMEQNMDNGELMVDDLVKELAVSRSVFFKKLKTLTGLAPIEFIKEMRVTRAAQLIETGDYNMTQIAYMVGINDPRYFSKCFKQRFGMTPTEYKEKKLTR